MAGCGRLARSSSIKAMRFAAIVLLGILAASAAWRANAQAPTGAPGQTKPLQTQPQNQTQRKYSAQAANANPELIPCTQVLAMSSIDYIAKTTEVNDSTQDGQLRGIRKYGSCYDARTDALAASLARSGKGPTKAVREEFASFQKDIQDFTEKALTNAAAQRPGANSSFEPVPSGAPKAAYASLYEKEFRYEFYEEYVAKAAKPVKPVTSTSKPTTTGAKSSTNAAAAGPTGASAVGANSSPHAATAEEQARSDADPVTQAKNDFGKILEVLPDDQMHEIHRAFSEVIGRHNISEPMRLAVYRYAIYILQPVGTTPAEPPQF
jgi:hypothetical protein